MDAYIILFYKINNIIYACISYTTKFNIFLVYEVKMVL